MTRWAGLLLTMAGMVFAEDAPLPVLIETDFNCDGRLDLALSDSREWGNAGGNWKIYLQRNDKRFSLAGSAFFHPLAFHIEKQSDGVGQMVVYHRSGGGEGSLVTFLIEERGVIQVGGEEFRPMEAEPESTNYKRYLSLFGGLREKPLHRSYSLDEILVTGDLTIEKS